jgi:lipopolysaccharide export system protein LptA
MKNYCLYWLLCTAPMAIPDTGTLSSTDASYDGSSLLLTGHVCLNHGLGKMTAEEASLQKQEAGKDFPFSLIQLRTDVILSLKDSAKICCGSADLDFTALKGTLLPPENGKVVYTDQIKKRKAGQACPLQLSGKSIDLNFSKQLDGSKTNYEIDQVLAKEEVLIEYADGFQLHAHRALYRKELSSDNKTSKREFQGVVTAYPQDEESQCRLVHLGDEILADMVDIDLFKSKISLLHPKGVLATAILPHLQTGAIRFQSDYLYWDQEKDLLTLKGNVTIDEPSIGKLITQDELQIVQTEAKGKHLLKSLEAKGDSTLLYKDALQHSHKLISHGTIHLDRDKLKATVESPSLGGVVPIEKQLYYEEEDIALYADHALIDYSIVDDHIEPSMLSLKGNIRLFSHDPLKPPRLGIADRLTYSITTRTLILSADPGKKVLFWDETQGVHLSAPEVHIVYDAQTKEQNVKGVGAVQFSFTPEEQSKLRRLFPQLTTQP